TLPLLIVHPTDCPVLACSPVRPVPDPFTGPQTTSCLGAGPLAIVGSFDSGPAFGVVIAAGIVTGPWAWDGAAWIAELPVHDDPQPAIASASTTGAPISFGRRDLIARRRVAELACAIGGRRPSRRSRWA